MLQLAALCAFMVVGISYVAWMTTNVSGEYGSCVVGAMVNATNTSTSLFE